MSTATKTHINTKPSDAERAAELIVRKLGGGDSATIEVVNDQSYLVPVSGPTIRLRQQGPAWITGQVGPHKPPLGVDTAEVLVVGYETPLPGLNTQSLQRTGPGKFAAHSLQELIPGELELVTIEARQGPVGQLGSAAAGSVVLEVGVLPETPAIISSLPNALGNSVAGALSYTPLWGEHAGQLAIGSKFVGGNLAEGKPDSNGIVVCEGVLDVDLWVVPGRGRTIGDGLRRVNGTVANLVGRSWPGEGRVRSAEVVGVDHGSRARVSIRLAVQGRRPVEGEVRR